MCHFSFDIFEAIRLHNGQLKVGNRCYQLSNNVYVAGFGKAAMGMSTATEEILGPHIVRGIVSIPLHTKETFAKNTELR